MKRLSFKLSIFVLFLFLSKLYSHESHFGRTETSYWDESKAYNGYTLFGTAGKTYLIDMEGHIINSWKIGTNPRLTPGGTIYDAAGGDPSKSTTWLELDWNGNTVWTYTEKRLGYAPHHDFQKIYNSKLGDSTFIYIANKSLTLQQCLEAGCDSTNSKNYSTAQMDVIVEVDMKGNVIWEWSFFNHVVQDLYPSKKNYGIVKDNIGKIDLNIRGNPVKSDWLHCNSLDYNEELDLMVINSVHGEFYVIDHGNTFIKNDPTTSISLAASSIGDFLYRFGDPAKYDQGDPPSVLDNWEKGTNGHKQLGGSHNIQWIAPGLPGAGNLMVFNNGQNLLELTLQSYVMEINPYLNSSGTNTGKFVNPPSAGYNSVNSPDKDLMKEKKNVSKQVVWSYTSKNNTTFFSTIGSSAQRLPNGNTLVCSDNSGHFFEVNPKDTSIVWEYINPVTRGGIKKIITDNYPMYNSCFRVYRYTSNYPGLVGKKLTAGSTITGKSPDYIKPSDLLTSVEEENNDDYYLIKENNSMNYPNPFTPSTTIKFKIDKSENVKISIYNFEGNFIKELANQRFEAGMYELIWDGTDFNEHSLNSGTYFYTIESETRKETKSMIYFK